MANEFLSQPLGGYGGLASQTQDLIQRPVRSIAEEFLYNPQTKTPFPRAMWNVPLPTDLEGIQELALPLAMMMSSAVSPKGGTRAIGVAQRSTGLKQIPKIENILDRIYQGGGAKLDELEIKELGKWAKKEGWFGEMTGKVINKNPARPEMAKQTEDIVLGIKKMPQFFWKGGKGKNLVEHWIVVGRDGMVRLHNTSWPIQKMGGAGIIGDAKEWIGNLLPKPSK